MKIKIEQESTPHAPREPQDGDLYLSENGNPYRLTARGSFGEEIWATVALSGCGTWSGWYDTPQNAVMGLNRAPVGYSVTLTVVED